MLEPDAGLALVSSPPSPASIAPPAGGVTPNPSRCVWHRWYGGHEKTAPSSRPARLVPAGFTLIEVLVTLVIVAIAASVVLTHVRTLLDLRSRYLAEQNAASDTLNRVALLPTLETSELRFRLKGDHIAILSREGDETLLEVRNIGTAGQPETPIDQAYTPFQHYRAAPESRYSVSLIKQSLPPPDL